MALPTKELDRLKPFKRINNEDFLVQEKPPAIGADRGCHTHKDLPDKLEDGLRDYIKKNVRVLGPLLTAFDAVNAFVNGLGSVLQGISDITRFIPIVGQAINVFTDVAKVFTQIAGIITDVLHEFIVDIGAELAKRAIRMIPQWVPVLEGQLRDGIRADQIKEVEGIATRSYGDPVASPFSQWHTWLNWSIQLDPEPQYANLVLADIATDAAHVTDEGTPVAKSGSFDVQWDVGALNGPQEVSDYRDGFSGDKMPKEDGPFTGDQSNWLWPTAGMYVWASGRWVFDCNRVDDVEASKPNTCAIMNPPRALATAVWEAVEFDENPLRPNSQLRCTVPAIRFMFIACKRGGYIDYNSDVFADTDYEFIVDLPPLPEPFPPFPIDFSPNIDHNKIVLRPRLLQKVEGLIGGDSVTIQPKVRVLPGEGPNSAPKQALVTIPADVIRPVHGSAGFILNMGWHDPTRIRARTVKRCSVVFSGVSSFKNRDNSVEEFRKRFKSLEERIRKDIKDRVEKLTLFGFGLKDLPTTTHRVPANLPEPVYEAGDKVKAFIDTAIDKAIILFEDLMQKISGAVESDEWLLRVGVNGRWRSVYFGSIDPGDHAIPGPALVFNFDLGPDDPLFIASNGAEFNALGRMMRDNLKDRDLELRRVPVDWNKICFPEPDLNDMVFEYAVQTLVGNSKGPLALGTENTALGLIDPGEAGSEVGSNPLVVGGLEPFESTLSLHAKFARTAPPEFGVYETAEADYDLHYKLKVDDLISKAPK